MVYSNCFQLATISEGQFKSHISDQLLTGSITDTSGPVSGVPGHMVMVMHQCWAGVCFKDVDCYGIGVTLNKSRQPL